MNDNPFPSFQIAVLRLKKHLAFHKRKPKFPYARITAGFQNFHGGAFLVRQFFLWLFGFRRVDALALEFIPFRSKLRRA